MVRKKLVFLFCLLFLSIGARAQFETNKKYIGASLSGLNLSYNGSEKTNLNIDAKGGMFFSQDLLLYGKFGWNLREESPNSLSLGVGGRYYVEQNGIFLGASGTFVHNDVRDDFVPSIQVGYAFFLSRTVTVEPELYYEHSFKNHRDFSTLGVRVGLGIYL